VTGVGVFVFVGVGVLDDRNGKVGLPELVIQKIRMNIPATTSTTAKEPIMNGPHCCLFLYVVISS
jgi:hypothetical protein